jgi:hypothetical protein
MDEIFLKYNWQEYSLCKTELKLIRGTDKKVPYSVNDFYPFTGKSASEEVKKMCSRCPVEDECREHALKHEKYGYWGGTSEKQRKILRIQMGIKFLPPQSNM